MLTRIMGAIVLALLLVAPAPAAQVESKVPSAELQEVLIKTYLLTLNDANVTGNYAVLQAKLAKPFRDQFSPERLKEVFKTFAEKKIDWGIIAAKPPVAKAETVIDKRGALLLRGYFDTKPSRVNYEIDLIPSEGEWKPIKLNVNVKPANEG
ncbi:MAG: hypothetical protein ACK4UO_19980 [Pseudolabrys sp.]